MAGSLLQAVVDMLLDQDLAGIRDRSLDRLQLLRDVETGADIDHHLDGRAQMALGPPQPGDDLRVSMMVDLGVGIVLHLDPILLGRL